MEFNGPFFYVPVIDDTEVHLAAELGSGVASLNCLLYFFESRLEIFSGFVLQLRKARGKWNLVIGFDYLKQQFPCRCDLFFH